MTRRIYVPGTCYIIRIVEKWKNREAADILSRP